MVAESSIRGDIVRFRQSDENVRCPLFSSWECLFLREPEIARFLDFVQQRKAPEWVYPMCVMAAHTGARRSEMLRAERQDVDFEAGIITIREKKRVRGKVTTRRVPISSRLKDALALLPSENGRLFGNLS